MVGGNMAPRMGYQRPAFGQMQAPTGFQVSPGMQQVLQQRGFGGFQPPQPQPTFPPAPQPGLGLRQMGAPYMAQGGGAANGRDLGDLGSLLGGNGQQANVMSRQGGMFGNAGPMPFQPMLGGSGGWGMAGGGNMLGQADPYGQMSSPYSKSGFGQNPMAGPMGGAGGNMGAYFGGR